MRYVVAFAFGYAIGSIPKLGESDGVSAFAPRFWNVGLGVASVIGARQGWGWWKGWK